MNEPLVTGILEALEVLVLERRDEGRLVIRPPAPTWMNGWSAPVGGDEDGIVVTEFFPFLESFLPLAEAFWKSGSGVSPRSGFWTEPLPDGREAHLEACAVRLDGGSYLVIRRVEAEFSAMQDALQLGRERVLEHERLLRETNAKEILLHCIVHDLAGPLAGIRGSLEMLSGTVLSPEAAEFVQVALQQSERQEHMIQEILDVFASEIPAHESDGADPPEAVDVSARSGSVVTGMRPAYLAKKVELRSEMAEDHPPGLVFAEPTRLERVLYNLLENALRFAPPRSQVTLRAWSEPEWTWIAVSDQGPGVSPELVPRLFQRMGGVRKGRGKSGLGLLFCRITVARWGGAIGYSPEPGGGARFRIRLRRLGSRGSVEGVPAYPCAEGSIPGPA